ncbi:branched-chain alpha-keto acid dehydrogenase subunit E2 [Arthrobacter sp. MYb227]|uniref:dihydrolipoamide acetyltransferase family protein n=1 Tax=Arthrobacter sp. MYb227 TaxID=1848601 RepID=UPI000CFA91F4|nr:dihydrolipoamide acetyltransferase family protein [Arthrobacter sp. MYb227]PQZ92961.1 branched-chain alpha-keto acid dehydrogenase subunit E2 [Arthrobacter sp. MYb227]
MEKLFNLPDLGEGLTESEIIAWKVGVGDAVSLNQIIAEIETAKAIVELPSPFSGTVRKIFEPVGAVVDVGNPIISFDVSVAAGSAASPPEAGDEAEKRQPTLVGYGAAADIKGRPARRGRTAVTAAQARPSASPQVISERGDTAESESIIDESRVGIGYLRARPPVRKLARDLHIDLRVVAPSGNDGLITREDVLQAQHPAQQEKVPSISPVTLLPEAPLASESSTPRETRVRVHGVRKATAAAMVSSAFSAPHVAEFLTVDITRSMELLERLRSKREFAGVKLTITTLVAKAVSLLLAKHQGLNSRWDEKTQEIIEFHYVNLGIAAATERGLLVPVVHEAQGMDLLTLAGEISVLTAAARNGSSTPHQLAGGTFSISNIGVFGIDSGTPILPPGQTGILALGQVRRMPWEFNDQIALREVMTLSLSFDHRVVDGEQGAKFLAELGMLLKDPGMLFALL